MNEVLEFAKVFNDSKWAIKSYLKLLKMFKNEEDDTTGVEAKVRLIVVVCAIAWDKAFFVSTNKL